MRTITLESIEIRNFKGVRHLFMESKGRHCVITGDNGTGKTSIYDAYLWCLFGTTSSPNTKVQTLNKNNDVIHHIETSVTMVLRIDNEYNITVESRLNEKWDAVGTPNERFKGTTIQRYYNGTPLSLKEYNSKLEAICDIKTWQMLSNIHSFYSMKMEDRRKMLMSIAGSIDEENIAKAFPVVIQATQERKTIEELTKQTKSTKKRAEDNLNKIPAAIDAQDRLIIVEDWDIIEAEINRISQSIADIDRYLEASPDELAAVSSYKEKVKTLEEKYNSVYHKKAQENKNIISKTEDNLKKAKLKLFSIEHNYYTAKKTADEQVENLACLTEEKESLKQQWRNVNKEEFSYHDTDVCPVCGNPFTDELKDKHRTTAFDEFLAHKQETLGKLETKVKLLNNQITALRGEVSIYNEVKEPSLRQDIANAESDVNSIKETLNRLYSYNVDNDDELRHIKRELEIAAAQAPCVNNSEKDEKKLQKEQLLNTKEVLIKKLSGKEMNLRIEQEKQRLSGEASQLSQVIADCDNALYQIRQFKKAKVDAVEAAVNKHFKLVTWKFFEKNITNDEEKEICTCILNGVEYESQNTASKVNMSVDILSGLSKAKGISVPMFIDNTESVTELLPSDNQQIALEVVKGKPISLVINNLN